MGLRVSTSHLPFPQVLTGGIPFPGIQDSAVGYHVLRGGRPKRPEDASNIGFSDSLWTFTQSCWHGEMESRPEVEEVVKHLGDAVIDWDGEMPPCSPAGDTVLDSGEPVSEELASEDLFSESDEPSEFEALIFLRCYQSSTAQLCFHRHGSPQVTPQGVPSNRNPPGIYSETRIPNPLSPPHRRRNNFGRAIARLFEEPYLESRLPTGPRSGEAN